MGMGSAGPVANAIKLYGPVFTGLNLVNTENCNNPNAIESLALYLQGKFSRKFYRKLCPVIL